MFLLFSIQGGPEKIVQSFAHASFEPFTLEARCLLGRNLCSINKCKICANGLNIL